LATEAAALIHWHGDRAPAVFEFDDELGALMIEEIDPGTALLETPHVLSPEAVGNLLNALHQTEGLEFSFPSVAQRVDYLFRSSTKLYDRHPDLVAVVPKRLYERGYELAIQLAQSGDRDVLLHGDLTPSNVLQGGANRGLVAIDPAPCLGDPAFDAIDLVMWKADDLDSIDARVSRLATITHVDQQRLRSWCSAFAGMSALEISSLGASGAQVEVLTSLALYK
jgi:streptomycin 6-kinase